MSVKKIGRIVSDEQKHKDAESADEGISDEESVLGHAPSEPEDIDETLKSVGLPSDENGPKELNVAEAVEKAEKDQWHD